MANLIHFSSIILPFKKFADGKGWALLFSKYESFTRFAMGLFEAKGLFRKERYKKAG